MSHKHKSSLYTGVFGGDRLTDYYDENANLFENVDDEWQAKPLEELVPPLTFAPQTGTLLEGSFDGVNWCKLSPYEPHDQYRHLRTRAIGPQEHNKKPKPQKTALERRFAALELEEEKEKK
jgi:hypothetical protein